MPPRIFKRADGFEPRDFIHFGLDHINAAEKLLKTSPSFFDSAGYLVHMGFELILKAWHLEAFGEFGGIHSLQQLVRQLREKGQELNLSEEEIEVLGIADEYSGLRYPNPRQGVEVGTDDWEKVIALLTRIWEQTPATFDIWGQMKNSKKNAG